MSSWLHTSVYRLRQVWQQLGFVAPLSTAERQEVAQMLPARAVTLFETMSAADQRHSLRVYHGLLARGCTEADMLAAALLHDVGKAQGRVPFWTRPVIVIAKRLAPGYMPGVERRGTGRRLAVPVHEMPGGGGNILQRWRRALDYAWWHAEIGADLAAAAGLSERAVLYIRTHHEPHGPAAELHLVDEAS
ncbi:MAG: hypothetical protein H0W02_15400 [Ktedonobacteraceae bacterium]|nr:hypothetical protein [Ktedonobacteraceae bacterium]